MRSWRLERGAESARHGAEATQARGDGAAAGGADLEEALAAAAALGRRITEAGGDEPAGLEARERGVDAAEADVAAGARRELLLDGDAVALIAEAERARRMRDSRSERRGSDGWSPYIL